jgi:CRP-like cAMP-binding protein
LAGTPSPAKTPSRATQEAIREQVRRTLPSLAPRTLQSLAETAQIHSLRTGEKVFPQGDALPLTLILEGHGAFRRTTIDGQQITLGIAPPGYLLGFTSMTADISTVDLVALTDCEVALWPGPEVRRLAASDPEFAIDMVRVLGTFLNALTEKVDGFLHQNARRRVVRVLARHRDLFFTEPPVLSRAHLPSLVGTSREMTGRVLRQLELEGTIARVGRTGIRLLRPDRLEADASQGAADEH